MRITSLSGALVLALGLGAAACGGDDGGGGDYETQGDVVEAFSAAICEVAARCEQLPEGTSESECVDLFTSAVCDEEDSTCDEPITDEDQTELDRLEDCLDAIDDVECPAEGEEPDLPAACQDEEMPTLRAALSKS
jgi:hypothetical protein